MPALTPDVVVLRGAPGVGKSTIAARLATQGDVAAVVEVDVVRRMLSAVRWGDSSQHLVALHVAAATAAEFAKSATPTLLVDALDQRFVPDLLMRLEGLGVFTSVIGLWCEPDEWFRRASRREKTIQNLADAAALNRQLTPRVAGVGLVIDTTGQDEASTAAAVAAGIRQQVHR